MTIRIGSLRGLEGLEDGEATALLEDYALAARRDHCSRADFAAGWRAAKLRFAQEHSLVEARRGRNGKLKLAV
jgi:hypothetical protein